MNYCWLKRHMFDKQMLCCIEECWLLEQQLVLLLLLLSFLLLLLLANRMILIARFAKQKCTKQTLGVGATVGQASPNNSGNVIGQTLIDVVRQKPDRYGADSLHH
jgi:hypothetical protein